MLPPIGLRRVSGRRRGCLKKEIGKKGEHSNRRKGKRKPSEAQRSDCLPCAVRSEVKSSALSSSIGAGSLGSSFSSSMMSSSIAAVLSQASGFKADNIVRSGKTPQRERRSNRTNLVLDDA